VTVSDTAKLGSLLSALLDPITTARRGVVTLVLDGSDGMWLATHDIGVRDPLSVMGTSAPAALAALVRERGLGACDG